MRGVAGPRGKDGRFLKQKQRTVEAKIDDAIAEVISEFKRNRGAYFNGATYAQHRQEVARFRDTDLQGVMVERPDHAADSGLSGPTQGEHQAKGQGTPVEGAPAEEEAMQIARMTITMPASFARLLRFVALSRSDNALYKTGTVSVSDVLCDLVQWQWQYLEQEAQRVAYRSADDLGKPMQIP